jgi:hypothetical protein
MRGFWQIASGEPANQRASRQRAHSRQKVRRVGLNLPGRSNRFRRIAQQGQK